MASNPQQIDDLDFFIIKDILHKPLHQQADGYIENCKMCGTELLLAAHNAACAT